MIGKFLCWLTLHKWGERNTTRPYAKTRAGALFQAVYVECKRPGCVAIKSAEKPCD